MLAATKVKMSGSEKETEQEHTQHFLKKKKKRVPNKFLSFTV